MKKIYLSLIVTVFSISFSYAQWTNIGGTGNYYLNSGYVGIGTTSPATPLDVWNGAIHIVGYSNDNIDGAYIGWSRSGGGGETNFTNNIGGGNLGGFTFENTTRSSLTTRLMTILGNGNVGIGTTNPMAADPSARTFQLGNNLIFQNVVGNQTSFSNNAYYDGGGWKYATADWASAIRMNNDYSSERSINFLIAPAAAAGSPINNGDWGNSVKMYIGGSGNVGIGTTNPGSYKLAVNGTIHSKAVIIDLIGWPDYVFKKDYQLMPLAQVKSYINQNHHLPDMPTDKEVEGKGLEVGEMNKLLTKKVEELTLYLIDQNKRIEKLEAAVAAKNK